ncbi:restriction endonuclease subunit S [Faecalibacterium wellingii]
MKNIQNIAINLPDYTTQERIASLLLSIDRKIELNQKINDNLAA